MWGDLQNPNGPSGTTNPTFSVNDSFTSKGFTITTQPGQVYDDSLKGSNAEYLIGQSHKGYDIVAPGGIGAEVNNFFNVPLEVVSTGESSSWGNYILVKPKGSDVQFGMGHLNSFSVKEGDVIQPGQPLLIQGSTGSSSGAHIDIQVMNVTGKAEIDKILGQYLK